MLMCDRVVWLLLGDEFNFCIKSATVSFTFGWINVWFFFAFWRCSVLQLQYIVFRGVSEEGLAMGAELGFTESSQL